MKGEHVPTEVTESREQRSYARLQGRWLLLARVGWVALVVLTLAIFFASLPVYVALLQTPCVGTACAVASGQLSAGQVGALKGMSLSLGDYAGFTVAITFAQVVVCVVVSTVIVWRRSHDRMALLVALLLVTFGPMIATSTIQASPSPWPVPYWAVRATLDALGPHRVAPRARPSGFPCAPHPHYPTWLACRARVSWRTGEAGGRAGSPLPARVQPAGAAADQVGGLRSRRARHTRIWGRSASVAHPNARRPQFAFRVAVPARRGHHHHLPGALDPALLWLRHAALSAVGD